MRMVGRVLMMIGAFSAGVLMAVWAAVGYVAHITSRFEEGES